jgi:cytochrome c biogenesis protein CcmG/thiol:disulfide interchange protein DsbE
MSTRRPVRVAPLAAASAGVVVIFLLVILGLSTARDTPNANTPLLFQPAPEIVAQTYDDQKFVLSRRKGSWVVLNFFNSTCVPCKREHPELLKFHAAQQGLGGSAVELYTIVNDDNERAVRAFFSDNGGGWPIIKDDDAVIAVDYGIAKVPETWLISPTGVVVERFAGQVTAEILGSAIAAMSESPAS